MSSISENVESFNLFWSSEGNECNETFKNKLSFWSEMVIIFWRFWLIFQRYRFLFDDFFLIKKQNTWNWLFEGESHTVGPKSCQNPTVAKVWCSLFWQKFNYLKMWQIFNHLHGKETKNATTLKKPTVILRSEKKLHFNVILGHFWAVLIFNRLFLSRYRPKCFYFLIRDRLRFQTIQ